MNQHVQSLTQTWIPHLPSENQLTFQTHPRNVPTGPWNLPKPQVNPRNQQKVQSVYPFHNLDNSFKAHMSKDSTKKTESSNSKNSNWNISTKCTNTIKTSKTTKRKYPSPFIPISSINTSSKFNKISGGSLNKNKWRDSETNNLWSKISGLSIKLKMKSKRGDHKSTKWTFNKIREFTTI